MIFLKPLGCFLGFLRVPWEALGAFWVDLGSPWGEIEASWGAFWASWGSLGGLLGPFGALLGRLGAKLSGLGAPFGANRFLIIFWSDFGSKKGAQMEAFWEPKRPKN